MARHRRIGTVLGSSQMSQKYFNNLTIVIVEDHDDARHYLGLFLGHLGANVVVARDAVEGLEAVKNYRPNLVLSDISMPGRDGFGLLNDIRSLGLDAGGGVPVIAMTAIIAHLDRARILGAGFTALLPKPFSPDKLAETIEKVINERVSG